MGSNFSLNNAVPPRSPSQSNSGYTRVEPEWSGSTSEGYRQLGTVRKSGYPAEEVAMPTGGQFILAPSTSTSEITADEKGIQLIDSSNSRLELEGTLEFKIESFLIKTRKIISKGEHGFGIGVDTKHFEPRSFKATLIEDEGTILLSARQDSKEIKLKIRSRNKRNRIMIDDLNTCGIVWIRVLAPK